jgi:hypothetical protein
MEQDWSRVTGSVDSVYPSWLLLVTATAIVVASFHVFSIDLMRSSALMGVVVVQLCKGLHLFGLPTNSIVGAALLILAVLYPFFSKAAQLSDATKLSAASSSSQIDTALDQFTNPANKGGTLLDILQVALYSAVVGACVLHVRDSVIGVVLWRVLGHPPSPLQALASMLCLWSGFTSCALLVYWRSNAFLRR